MKKLALSLLISFSVMSCAQQRLLPNDISSEKEAVLKGSDTEFRNFWDVKKYNITVEPDFTEQSLSGKNIITFEITKDVKNPVFQIDLHQPMEYEFLNKDNHFETKREGDFIFITAKKSYKKGNTGIFEIRFSGKPKIAKKAPWDGGWVFSKDKDGNPWASVAQEGEGVSLWLPVKDIWSDEPDSGIIMNIITPKDLAGVGNGRLSKTEENDGKKTYTWEVKNPINGYSIVPTIGKFVNFKDTFQGEKGTLDLDYWVLEENLEKAKIHFPKNVQPMLKAFENWFGSYPFYEDSFKLVDTPYLGMEHQSNVAYGNRYLNGYLGRDLSGTGYGLNWDFIIIHEAGHEWFANNITAKDQADMWIHESFTTYSEVLFVNDFTGKEEGNAYAQGIRRNIQNDGPMIGKYGIRNEGSGDIYPKGANMIHTIRQVMNDDEKFRQMLRSMNKDFYHQTVTTQQIEKYISEKAGFDFSGLFNQYLRTTDVPVLEYSQDGNQLKFRYTDIVDDFKLPVRINEDQTLNPAKEWQTVTLNSAEPVKLDRNYYIVYKKL
ncbi:MAG: M1 family metallopeptidase [Bergeyella sp.]